MRSIPAMLFGAFLVSVAQSATPPAPASQLAAAPEILTPPSPAAPQIRGPKIFGARPGNPFLFAIAATGDRPMTFSADGLPAGLALDSGTGIITGTTLDRGEHRVTLHAANGVGSTHREFHIAIADRIALTPPMGWNTYYPFRLSISDAAARRAADAMVASGLTQHGWTYINLDEGWSNKPGATDLLLAGPVRDNEGHINSNQRFPDMKNFCDYIHAKGLKAGIYSSPGPLGCGGYAGSYQHEDDDVRTFADWGFDYVKYDWCSYAKISQEIRKREYARLLPASTDQLRSLLTTKDELEANRARTAEQNAQLRSVTEQLDKLYATMDAAQKRRVDLEIAQAPYRQLAASLSKVRRDMVFSLCQYGMENPWEWGEALGGNCWRTTRDIVDSWSRVSDIGFGQAGLEKYAGPGHWNDPDMLQVGVMVRNIPSRLTADEQYAHVSLWCLLAAPLLIGGDLNKLDPFTLNLLTNDEVLEVNQDPLGKQAGRIAKDGTTEVWAKEMEDGSRAVGLFNRGDTPSQVRIAWQVLGLTGRQVVRDLWRQRDLGSYADQFAVEIPMHGVRLVKIRPANRPEG